MNLDGITGGDLFEVLRSLILAYVPNGNTIVTFMKDFSMLFLILGILAGISQCFFGQRLRKIWTAFLMTTLCGCAGAFVSMELELSTGAFIGVTAGAAVIGGLLGYFVWIIGCFLRPLIFVSLFVFSVFAINHLQIIGLIVGLAAGLIAAIVTTVFYKKALLVYTSICGGLFAGICIVKLTTIDDLWYLPLIIGAVLALIGSLVQVFLTQEREKNGASSTENAFAEEGQKNSITEAAAEFAVTQEGLPTQSTQTGEMGNDTESAADSAQDGKIENAGEAAACGAQVSETGVQDVSERTDCMEANTTEAEKAVEGDDAAGSVCPSCGMPHNAGAKFCMYCGQKLIE